MPSGMMGQLVLLQERLAQCGGALRICGLSPECEETLHELPAGFGAAESCVARSGGDGQRRVSRCTTCKSIACRSQTSSERACRQTIVCSRIELRRSSHCHYFAAVEILLADLPQRFERRLGLVCGVEQAAVRIVVRRGVGELVPEDDLDRVLRQQQRHVPLDPVALRFGRDVARLRC